MRWTLIGLLASVVLASAGCGSRPAPGEGSGAVSDSASDSSGDGGGAVSDSASDSSGDGGGEVSDSGSDSSGDGGGAVSDSWSDSGGDGGGGNGAAPDGMVLIPAGSFKMGCVAGDTSCYSDESPQHTVTLDAYYMDVYEVSVAKYKQCVDAKKCTAAGTWSAYCNGSESGKEQHPVNCVEWTQADTFCKWAGGRLPTEAQWEKAARGGLEGKVYPWGDAAPTCTPGQPNTVVWSDGGKGCGTDSTWPVGKGSSKNGYGLYDMSGNVWEWVNDWYGSSYYSSSPPSNPQGPASGSYRIARGGSFNFNYEYNLRASVRYYLDPSFAYFNRGFRCSRSVP